MSDLKRTKLYLHGDKDGMFERGKKLGLEGDALSRFGHAFEELELEVDVDDDGIVVHIVTVDGIRLDPEADKRATARCKQAVTSILPPPGADHDDGVVEGKYRGGVEGAWRDGWFACMRAAAQAIDRAAETPEPWRVAEWAMRGGFEPPGYANAWLAMTPAEQRAAAYEAGRRAGAAELSAEVRA